MCQFFFFLILSKSGFFKNKIMSTCNQISAAAKKVTMIRRARQRKSVSSCNNQTQTVSSVVHQTNNLITSEKLTQDSKYMNTYRLESKNPFNCVLVQNVIEEVVQKQCFGVKYDAVKCASKVQSLAGEILQRVKNFQFDRYRFIVFVQIGSNQSQEFETAAKFLWDSTKDKLVTYNLKSGSMFTTATCFGVYKD